MVTFNDDYSEEQKKDNGWFPVPHGVFLGDFAKSELMLLLALYKLQNRYGGAEAKEFHHSNLKVCLLTRMSEKSIIKARKALVKKGIIKCNPGSSGRETSYHIITSDEHKIQSVKKTIENAEQKNKLEALKAKKVKQLERARKDSSGAFIVDEQGFYSVWKDRYTAVKAKLNQNYDWIGPDGEVI